MPGSFDYRQENPPSAAVLAARSRRLARNLKAVVETQWFIDEVSSKVAITMRNRVRIATELVKSKVVLNISRPVTKTYVSRKITTVDSSGKSKTKTVNFVSVSDRSKPEEFPKADTTQLMKTIFSDIRNLGPGMTAGYVGTPLDYGLILELRRKRWFLSRTLNEERPKVMAILTGPIK